MIAMLNRGRYKKVRNILVVVGVLVAAASGGAILGQYRYQPKTEYSDKPINESLTPDQRKKYAEDLEKDAKLSEAVDQIIRISTRRNIQQAADELRKIDGVVKVSVGFTEKCNDCMLEIEYKSGPGGYYVLRP